MAAESTKPDDDQRRDASKAALLLVAGEGLLATHALTSSSVLIGRDPECDLVVNSATLSRRHACLRLGPAVTIQDLGSQNGTRIGGVLHRGGDPVPFTVGESFQVGKLSFMLLDAPQAPTPKARSELGRPLQVIDPGRDRVSAHVRDIAKSDVNVLILGETGVGKEVLAETLHAWSERRGPLVGINCAALSATLLESELFGHEKGAFTGASEGSVGIIASAHGGTLLLDEVGELSPALQAKLLRVIETKEVLRLGSVKPKSVDVRFIAATNRDLPAEAAQGQFRADLLYRLDGVTLSIPPLRQRRQLIGPLAWQFLGEAQRAAGREPAPLPGAVLRLLEKQDWPGNVRELRAAMQRAVLLTGGRELQPRHFSLGAPSPFSTSPRPTSPPPALSPPSHGDDGEQARIVAALEACAGNQTRAAQLLGISRTTLVHKIALHRIRRPRK
ncbi:MAG TPA: sigma 54-interacting transcriptional regulator [Solirubrobacteraceae bacterium]|jgi:DNA-binding NtrC family response regulator|nr:sigma 54-interacting transcriptional regulator [Solirubrobacteraceae bacterium]